MLKLNPNETLDNTAQASYVVIDREIESRNKRYFRKKGILSFLLILILVLTLLYFVLPPFKMQSISIDGLVNFTKEDYLQFAGYNANQSILLYDDNSDEKVVSSSQSLFLSSESKSTLFNVNVKVNEDFPFASYDGIVYCLSGKTEEEFCSSLDSLDLADGRKEAIKALTVSDDIISSLPVAHLPKGFSGMTLNSSSLAFSQFVSLDKEIISQIRYIQFRTDSIGKWTGFLDVIIEDPSVANNNLYAFVGLTSDNITSFFKKSDYYERVIQVCRRYIGSGFTSADSYTFLDDDTIVENVYKFGSNLWLID
ncbi:MAG: hypothetical protein WCR67_02420 [Bacilli bacterium]